MTVLVSLMSDQRMQQVILLLQKRYKVEKIIFIVSGEFGKRNEKYWKLASELKQALSSKVEIDLFDGKFPDSTDLRETGQAVLKAIQNLTDKEIMVNITGGTKPMALSAFQLSRTKKDLVYLYVDTEKEMIHEIKGDRVDSFPFDLDSITIDDILKIHGELVEPVNRGTEFRENEVEFVREFFQGQERTLFSKIREFREDHWEKLKREANELISISKLQKYRDLVDTLEQYKLIERSKDQWRFPPVTHQFLDGGWLEVYVYQSLKRSGKFMDVAGRVKVKHSSDGNRPERKSEDKHELDVACVQNAKLGIIECKRTVFDDPVIIQRLHTLRDRLGGRFSRAFLVTDSSKIKEETRKVAGKDEIVILSGDDLPNAADRIFQAMQRETRPGHW